MLFEKDRMEIEDKDETYDDFVNDEYEPSESEIQEEETAFEHMLNREMKSLDEVLKWKWTKTTSFSPHQSPPFTTNTGPFTALNASSKVIDFFHLIFDEQLQQDLVNFTNEYGDHKINNSKRRRKKQKLWEHTDRKEFQAFIGIMVLMSLVKKTEFNRVLELQQNYEYTRDS